MIDLISKPTDSDLAWMRKVHRPDELLHAPVQLPDKFGSRDGKVICAEPHALCVRGDAACVHRGMLPGVAVEANDAVLNWAGWTFFLTLNLKPLAPMTRDGFERWVREAKAPTVELCGRCGGKGVDPDAKPAEDGLLEACSRCHGEPRRVDDSAAVEQVGPMRVILADLKPFLAHLGPGGDIGVGYAPRVNVDGAYDLHVRAMDLAAKHDGAWRLCLMALDEQKS